MQQSLHHRTNTLWPRLLPVNLPRAGSCAEPPPTRGCQPASAGKKPEKHSSSCSWVAGPTSLPATMQPVSLCSGQPQPQMPVPQTCSCSPPRRSSSCARAAGHSLPPHMQQPCKACKPSSSWHRLRLLLLQAARRLLGHQGARLTSRPSCSELLALSSVDVRMSGAVSSG